MKNLLNIIYRKEDFICPCGNVDGCRTVSEMHACDNLDKQAVEKEQKFAIILPSKINEDVS